MTKKVDFLLIGGGLASAVAAETIRKEGEQGEITILCAENVLPYHRSYLFNDVFRNNSHAEQILVVKDKEYKEKNIEVLLNTKALAVDTKNKIVKTDHAGEIEYKKLLIATGCIPTKMDLPGCSLPGIHYLRTLDDSIVLNKEIKKSKNVIIIGGIYLAVELASCFTKLGLKVTCIAKEFNFIDKKLSPDISKFLKAHDVEVIMSTIKEFKGEGHVQSVLTNSGKTVACDFVVIVKGFKPDVDFLDGSHIKIDDGVVVNQRLQTNDENVYAAGDVANLFDPVYERYHRIESWDNAIKQGKIAARNMVGQRQTYRTVSYFFFYAFDYPFMFLGDTTDADEKIIRGSVEEKTFAILYLKNGLLRAAFFLGRPITEIKAAESLIVNRVDLTHLKKDIMNINFPMEEIASQNILTLQGGGALGAFECGVIKAMQEENIHLDIVAGISIGAFNSAIIAGNPDNAAEKLQAFWEELTLNMPPMHDEEFQRILSSWCTILWGLPNFFHPRWLMQFSSLQQMPWTSFYDPTPIKDLLCKYVDFSKLKNSPIRLLVMAVNVETAEFEVFDSYTDDITPDHILASGSLPPGFPWIEINGKYYWDGGIVSNTPLDAALEICGSTGKHIYVVDLYPKHKGLPQNLVEVMARKDEILFSEKIRRDMRTRDFLDSYRKIVEFMMTLLTPDIADKVRQIPVYIQTVGDPGVLSITRIMREMDKNELDARDSDFSNNTIQKHIEKGYKTAKKILQKKPLT